MNKDFARIRSPLRFRPYVLGTDVKMKGKKTTGLIGVQAVLTENRPSERIMLRFEIDSTSEEDVRKDLGSFGINLLYAIYHIDETNDFKSSLSHLPHFVRLFKSLQNHFIHSEPFRQ